MCSSTASKPCHAADATGDGGFHAKYECGGHTSTKQIVQLVASTNSLPRYMIHCKRLLIISKTSPFALTIDTCLPKRPRTCPQPSLRCYPTSLSPPPHLPVLIHGCLLCTPPGHGLTHVRVHPVCSTAHRSPSCSCMCSMCRTFCSSTDKTALQSLALRSSPAASILIPHLLACSHRVRRPGQAPQWLFSRPTLCTLHLQSPGGAAAGSHSSGDCSGRSSRGLRRHAGGHRTQIPAVRLLSLCRRVGSVVGMPPAPLGI